MFDNRDDARQVVEDREGEVEVVCMRNAPRQALRSACLFTLRARTELVGPRR